MSSDRSIRPIVRSLTRLLAEAIQQLEVDELAQAIGISRDDLVRWAAAPGDLTFHQETAAVMGVLTLAPQTSDLFRAAATLRSRLAARLEYELGITRTTENAPHNRFNP